MKEREREGGEKKSEGGGRREAAQKRWPNLPPQPISPTLGSVARIQDDLYVIPAIWNCNTQRSNSFRERVRCTRRDTYSTHIRYVADRGNFMRSVITLATRRHARAYKHMHTTMANDRGA